MAEPKNFVIYTDQLGTWTRRVADRDEAIAFLKEWWEREDGAIGGCLYLDTEVAWVDSIADWEIEPEDEPAAPTATERVRAVLNVEDGQTISDWLDDHGVPEDAR